MRNKLTILVAVIVIVGPMTGSVTAVSIMGSDDVEDQLTQVHYDGNPSYIVEVENNSMTMIEDWASSSEDFDIIEKHDGVNKVLISAPAYSVDYSLYQKIQTSFVGMNPSVLFQKTLASESYIEEIYVNYRMSYTEPITNLKNESTYSEPEQDYFGFSEDPFSAKGIAFDNDADETKPSEYGQIVGDDEVVSEGNGITVSVIDTGVNVEKGQIYGNGTSGSDIRIADESKNMLTGDTVGANGFEAVEDGNGHGSWVASAVAANYSDDTYDGLAPNAELLVVKALNDEGSAQTDDIAEAIRYSADNGADVISMSLGSPVYSGALDDSIQYAFDHNVSAVVVAVGNSRQTTRWIASPADSEGVIAVGAVNGEMPNSAESAYFSQIGPDPGTRDGSDGLTQGERVDVVAPGMETVAMTSNGAGSITESTLSGTSMATPIVAGGIASALSANENLNDEEYYDVRKWVRDGAIPIPNASSTEVGHGMFSVENLVNQEVPKDDQDEVERVNAKQRGTVYKALSDSSGGLFPFNW